MRDASKKLLQKLANGRPKPTKQTLENLFTDIQNSTIDALVTEFSPSTQRRPAARTTSPLEAHTKSKLRKVSGRVKDFLPYLMEAAARRDSSSISKLKAGKSLSAKITKIESLFGANAKLVVDEALEKFTSENDVSYRLADN